MTTWKDIFGPIFTVDNEAMCHVCKSTNAIEEKDGVRRCKACQSTFDQEGTHIATAEIETILAGNLFRLFGLKYDQNRERVKRLCPSCAERYPTGNRCLYAFRDNGPCVRCNWPCTPSTSVAYKGDLW
jgi:ribosomal protein L37AE/L43A